MTTTTVTNVDADQADDKAPPHGTAIVRPLRHVRAVRERYLQRFTDAAEAAGSRSARAWGWALGETAAAPVTDRQTAVPPSRADIEAEIAVADERRLRGDRENRADAAATMLRWLIGDDDRVPVRCENPGELVSGFGDIVRSPEQIADMLAAAAESQRQVAAFGGDVNRSAYNRRSANQDTDYLGGVVATLAWILGDQAEAPATHRQIGTPTIRDIKLERVRAEDLVDPAASPWMGDREPSRWYGEGVKVTIAWLLGDSIVPPVS